MSKEEQGITIKDLESKLWKAADTLRGNLSAEDYMHVVLGILTIKYINDKNENAVKKLTDEGFILPNQEPTKEDLMANDAFVISEKSKWETIRLKIGTNEIGLALDDAIETLGKDNKELFGVFSAKYNSSDIDKTRLSEVVKLFQTDNFYEYGEDILGRIYEYFLGEFFLKRGQKGGEFYTPKSIVKLITMFIKPTKGKIYDPCCGSGGMFVQAKQYILDYHGNVNDITVYGQEFNSITWKLAKLNLLLHGMSIFNIDNITQSDKGALGNQAADTFTNDQHIGKVFDYVMANPPFNLKQYWNDVLENDPRWKYGIPPKNNANYAWIQHILYKMSSKAKAGVVLANGSLTSTTSNEDKIREKIIKDNKISCIISLPDKLFYTTQIPACIWFFDNDKKTNDILMIDAQNMGNLVEGSKKQKELDQADLDKLTKIFDDFNNGEKIDIPGLAKSVSLNELEVNNFSLSPGRYITILEENKKSEDEIKQELKQSIQELTDLMDESNQLEKELLEAIKKIQLD